MRELQQNKFLETIITLSKSIDSTFFIANAKVNHFPIIYCSEDFSDETGFPRYEVTRHDVFFGFLHGRQTSTNSIEKYKKAIHTRQNVQIEMLLYSKYESKSWYLITVIPVKDSNGDIGFFLIFFNNISDNKEEVKTSPRRQWRRAVKKILNKPCVEEMCQRMKSVEKKSKKTDLETIRQRLYNIFIPEYGTEVLQVPSNVINQFHVGKLLWDFFILLLILYTAVTLPYSISFDIIYDAMAYIDVCIDTIFIIDIVLNFFTTYTNEAGDVVSSLKRIRIHYLKGWFTLDFLAAVPYWFYNMITLAENDALHHVRGLTTIRVLRLLRITKIRKKAEVYMQRSSFTLGVWIFAFCVIGHWMACIWYALAIYIDNPYTAPYGWLNVLAEVTNETYQFQNGKVIPGTGPSHRSLYFSALYYVLSSLTTCGFGNIAPNTVCEKIFGCITMIIGCVLYAFIFGQVTNIISQLQRNSNEYKEQLEDIRSFNNIYKVPNVVAKRLEDYFRSTWAVTKGTDEEEILRMCPRDLQSDLCLHIHSKIFQHNKGFARLSSTSLRAISRYLSTIRTATGDKLVFQGEYVDTIYFVATGAFEVKNGDNIMGLIGPGDAFGQRLGYVEQSGKSLYDVVACSFGTIHCITRDNLREALMLFPEEYDKIRYGLVLSLDITRQIKVDSLLASENAARKDSVPIVDGRKSIAKRVCTDIYVHEENYTEVENYAHSDVLCGMSELKGELRRETERMNAKMGVLEAQMRLVLKLLRRKNIEAVSEIDLRLKELDGEDEMDSCNVDWAVADSRGWKSGGYSDNQKSDAQLTKLMVVDGVELGDIGKDAYVNTQTERKGKGKERKSAHAKIDCDGSELQTFERGAFENKYFDTEDFEQEEFEETIKL